VLLVCCVLLYNQCHRVKTHLQLINITLNYKIICLHVEENVNYKSVVKSYFVFLCCTLLRNSSVKCGSFVSEFVKLVVLPL
jgi:hypothetical protein